MIPVIIEQVLREQLLAIVAVQAIVGDRIRPGELDPQDTLPAITIELDEETREIDLEGDGGLVEAEMLITAHADRYLHARQLCNAIAHGDGTELDAGLSNWGAADVETHLISTKRVLVDLKDGGGGKRNLFVSRYRVVYREPT